MTPYGKRGLIVRLIYLAAAYVWWHVTAGGRWCRRGIVVLCYHDVREDQRDRFARQMSLIANRAVGLDDLARRRDADHPGVMTTFDDALSGVKDHALPVLEKHGVPATIFAVTGCAGRTPDWPMPDGHPDQRTSTLCAGEWRELDAPPRLRIESHSATHADLSRVNDTQLDKELRKSKGVLEQALGRSVTCLALPYGGCDGRVLEAARRAGYEHVFTLEARLHEPAGGTRAIGRFATSPDMWPIEFRLTIDGAYGWLAEWRRTVRRMRAMLARRSWPVERAGAAVLRPAHEG